MKLGFSAADEAFRQECADWLNAEMAGEFRDIKGITKLTASPERREEIARMLAGETVTDEARAAAARLLAAA